MRRHLQPSQVEQRRAAHHGKGGVFPVRVGFRKRQFPLAGSNVFQKIRAILPLLLQGYPFVVPAFLRVHQGRDAFHHAVRADDGGQTLTDTGRLRRSIDYATTSDTVMVGSNLKYARIHQKGGTITPKKAKKLVFKGRGGKKVAVDQVTIPARPYLGISDEDMDDVKSTMTDFLAGVFKA